MNGKTTQGSRLLSRLLQKFDKYIICDQYFLKMAPKVRLGESGKGGGWVWDSYMDF